jgi:hypothetical protein
MEQLRNDGGAVPGLNEQDVLERARAMFERKAGVPVSAAEAREWLDSLVGFYRRIERWVVEDAAEKAAMERQQEIQPLERDPSRDTQGLPPAPASRRLPAQRKTGRSTRCVTGNTRNVHKGVQIERAAPAGAQRGRE